MRSLLLSILFVFVSSLAFSQTLTGAAATYEKNLKNSLAELKMLNPATHQGIFQTALSRTESYLKQLQKAAPDYNTSEYEAELAKFQKTAGSSNASNAQSFKVAYDKAFNLVMCRSCWNMDPQPDIAKADAKLQSHIADMNAVANSEAGQNAKNDNSIAIQKQLLPSLKAKVEANSDDVSYLLSDINQSVKKYETASAYYKLLAREQFWIANLKIFPDLQGMQQALVATQEAIKQVGSYENAIAIQKRNVQKLVDAERIPAAKRNDPALEAELKKLFAQSDVGKGKTILRVSITSPDWVIKRDPITDKIVQRVMDFYIGYKDSSGDCFYHFGNLHQPYQGGGYGSTTFLVNDPIEISCENVSK